MVLGQPGLGTSRHSLSRYAPANRAGSLATASDAVNASRMRILHPYLHCVMPGVLISVPGSSGGGALPKRTRNAYQPRSARAAAAAKHNWRANPLRQDQVGMVVHICQQEKCDLPVLACFMPTRTQHDTTINRCEALQLGARGSAAFTAQYSASTARIKVVLQPAQNGGADSASGYSSRSVPNYCSDHDYPSRPKCSYTLSTHSGVALQGEASAAWATFRGTCPWRWSGSGALS